MFTDEIKDLSDPGFPIRNSVKKKIMVYCIGYSYKKENWAKGHICTLRQEGKRYQGGVGIDIWRIMIDRL